MNKKVFLPIAFFLIIMAVFSSFQTQQDHKVLFEKAKYTMETKADLTAAIDLFESLIKQYPNEKEYVAKSLLYQGLCYEKLGNQQAVKKYRQIVDNYPGQKNEVAYARERLSKLIQMAKEVSTTPSIPKFTKIQIPVKLARGAQLSPDGKRLTFSSIKYEGSLWTIAIPGKVSPDIAGQPKKLIGEDKVWGWGHDWSADGKWIAFNYMKNDKDIFVDEVHVISSSGGELKKIKMPVNRGGSYHMFQYSLSLSPDGKNLAYASKEDGNSDKPNESYIYTIPVNGGVAKRLTDSKTWLPAFSPDGKKIAYIKKSIEQDELWVIPSLGGTSIKVCDLGGKAWGSPVWAPGSDMIAFLREPKPDEKCKEIGLVPLSETGSSAALPLKIELPFESSLNLAGWTSDNKVGLLMLSPVQQAIYTIPSAGGKATQVTPAGGEPFSASWNNSGKRIYFTDKGNLSSVVSEGGEIFSIPVAGIEGVNFPVVSPDGKKVLFHGFKKGVSGMHIWTVPIEGGEPKQVVRSPFEDDFIEDAFPRWSPDGKTICFWRNEKTREGNGVKSSVCLVPADGGDVKVLISDPDSLMKEIGPKSMCWSPDGKSIVHYCMEDGKIKTIPVDSGEPQVLAELQKGMDDIWFTFSPDGKEILYTANSKIWTISLNGEEPVEIKTGLDTQPVKLAWSPDGKNISFTARKGGDIEFWFMEDFLPLDKLAQNKKTEAAKEPEGITINQVWTGIKADNTGSISSNGKYLSFVDWDSGNLAIRDLTKGTSQSLTKEGTYEGMDQYAYSSVISPDCKQIAYAWLYNSTYELRLLNIDNPVPKTLYRNENESVFPAFWLSDGKKLIAKRYLSNSGKTKTQIISIDISDGSVNVLKTIESDYQMRLSPSLDNKYIAYEHPNDLNSKNYDIHLLSMDGTFESILTNHPASDKLLGWMPGNNKVLFISNRSGSWDLWSVQVKNGKLLGLPVRILPEIGEISPLGFTKDGSLYYSIFSRMFTGLITSFNMETGIAGQMESKSSIPGSVRFVEWSPDGESVAYGKEEKRQDDYFCKLCVQDLTTGTERCFDENFRIYNNSIRWNSDNQTILAVGYDETKRGQKNYFGGIYTFDTKTGQMNEILLLKSFENEYNPLYVAVAEWSADGKSIFYLSYSTDGDKTGNQITKYVLKTGEEKVIYKGKHLKRILRLSPTSDNLLFAYVNPENKKVHICTIPTEGGEVKEICTSQETERLSTAAWFPDGKSIFFAETPTLDYSKLWRVYSDGGKPQYVCQLPHLDVFLSIHPSGQKVALTYGEQTTEIRKIENLEQGLNSIYSQNE